MVKKRGTNNDHHSSEESVAFTDAEKELIRILLEYGEKNPDRWVDCARIGKKLYGKDDSDETSVKNPQSAVWNILQRLESKLSSVGVELRRTTSTYFKTNVYSLNPEDEKKIESVCPDLWPQRNEPLKLLYLGELGFGTRAYDPRAGKALGYFLRHNLHDGKPLYNSVDGVVLSGGVVPFVPEYYSSAIGANSMVLLDKKAEDVSDLSEKEAEERLNAYLEHSKMNPELKEFLKKHLAGKILTKSDAVKTARKRLEDILGTDFKGEVHYMYGEEDDANLQQLKEIEIVRHLEETEQLGKQQGKLEEDLGKLRKVRDEYQRKQQMFENMQNWLTRAVDYKGAEFSENVKKFIEHHKADIQQLNDVSSNLGKNVLAILKKAKSKKDIEKKLRESRDSLQKAEQEIKDADLRGIDLQNRLDAIKRTNEARGFFKITKRVQLNAEQHEMIWATVSKEYEDLLRAAFPASHVKLHPEHRADVRIKDRFFRLEHTLNIRSNNPEKDSLKRMKAQSNLSNKLGLRVPDVYITAHGTGMRHQPQPKYAESIDPHVYREPPEINMLIKLGTFHSNQKLEYLLRNKQKKNWMVKRFENNYSSGAFIHSMHPDYSQRIECIPTENLIELGFVAEQLEEAGEAARTANGEKKKSLEAKIKKLEAEFVLCPPDEKDLIKITMLTDAHIGCPTWPGRPTNYAFLDAAIQQESSTRLPDVLVMTEMLHGALTRPFFSDKEVYKLKRHELEKAIENINTDNSLSADERNKLLSTLLLLEDSHRPIPSLDEQAKVFDVKVMPFAKKVIANGGIVVIASGNHYGKSSAGVTDEAEALARKFDEGEQNSLYVLHGKGTSFGAGQVPLTRFGDARKTYISHRLKRGSDEITELKEQALGMNVKDALFLGGDAHQAGVEYANRTHHAIGAGLQGWTPYVAEIGKQAGLRGVVDFYFSSNPKLKNYCRVDYVLDPTLEAGMKEQINVEKKLIEKYIPHPK